MESIRTKLLVLALVFTATATGLTAQTLSLGGAGPYNYTEQQGALTLAPAGTWTDAAANYSGFTLTVSGTIGNDLLDLPASTGGSPGEGAGNIVERTFGGIQIGTVAGGTSGSDLVITWNATATAADIQSIIQIIEYDNAVDNPNTAGRTITFTETTPNAPGSDADSLTLNLTNVNDPPTLTTFGSPFTTGTEDTDVLFTGADMFTAGDEADVDGVVNGFRINSINGTLVRLPATTLAVNDVIVSADNLRWTPPSNVNGTVTMFTVSARDSGSPLPAQFSGSVAVQVSLAAVNDPPTLTNVVDFTGTEDVQRVITFAQLQTNANEADVDGAVDGFRVEAISSGTLTIGGGPVTVGVTVLTSGQQLEWTPPTNANGVQNAFTVIARDNGTPLPAQFSSPPEQVRVNLAAVNDPPTLTAITSFSGGFEDQTRVITFTEMETNANEADVDGSVVGFRYTGLTSGSLQIDTGGGPVAAVIGDVINTGDSFHWLPPLNSFSNPNPLDAFTVVAVDNGTPGTADSISNVQVRVQVAPVNDAPSFAINGAIANPITHLEDAGAQSIPNFAINFNPGPANESTQGILQYNVVVTGGGSLFAVNPAIDNSGTLTYTLAADANGAASFNVTVTDNGGTPNGGNDTSSVIGHSVSVTAVNDAPSFTSSAIPAVNEDAGPQTVNNFATLFDAGPADEDVSQSLVGYFVQNVSVPAAFASGPFVSNAGVLTYETVANYFGTVTFDVRVQDNGGTAFGGDDDAVQGPFTITVNAVNDAPTLSTINTLGPTPEDTQFVITHAALLAASDAADVDNATIEFRLAAFSSGTLTDNGGGPLTVGVSSLSPGNQWRWTPATDASGVLPAFEVVAWDGALASTPDVQVSVTVTPVNDAPTLTSMSTIFGGPEDTAIVLTHASLSAVGNEADVDSSPLSFRIKNLGAGTLEIDEGSGFNPAVFNDSIDSSDLIRWTPPADANGTLTAFQVVAYDGSLESTTNVNVPVFVDPVNDRPSFTGNAIPASNEDAGPQAVAGAAIGFSAGPANESGQAVLQYVVSNVTTTLGTLTFSSGPSVDTTGQLTYTATANTNGSATFDLVVRDNGGTNFGGLDTSSPAVSFTITVNAVDDAPSFTGVSVTTVNEDSGAFSNSTFATGFNPGGGSDESGQTATSYNVSNVSNPALFASGPVVNALAGNNGQLQFTLNSNIAGSSTFDVTVTDSGTSVSTSQTFTISVTEINDAPSFSATANVNVNEDANPQSITGWASGFNPGANEGGQTVLGYSVSNVTGGGLLTSGPSVSVAGTLSFTPAANANGVVTFDVTVQDSGGTAGGGVDSFTVTSRTITIVAVNDAPTLSASNPPPVNEDAGAQTVNGWATFSPGPANESAQTVFSPNGYSVSVVATTGNLSFAAAPAVSNAGTLTYTPTADTNGTATIDVTVRDNAGGTDTSVIYTFTITVNAVADAPSFTANTPIPTVLEGAGAQSHVLVTVPGSFNPGGGSDEAGETVASFNVSNVSSASSFASLPTVNNGGTLNYELNTDAWGSFTFDLTVTDSGAATSSAQTFTINVTGVNDAPSFIAGANPTVAEDAGPQSVLTWATGFNPGPNESGQTILSYVISNVTGGGLLSAGPSVDTSGNLTFTPAANANGVVTFDVAVRDNGGTAGTGQDTSATSPVTITITAVNDAPSFTASNPPASNEDAGAQSVLNWAVFIPGGGSDESGQSATSYNISAIGNPALFSALPAVNAATGELTYTAATDAFGSSTLTVSVTDDGTPAATSVAQVFTVTVNPVNDAPSFTASNPPASNEDAGAITVSSWAAFSAGPPNEAGQAVLNYTVNLVGTTGTLAFSSAPAVNNSGTLTYTAAADTNGTATISVTVRDNAGGLDTSAAQVFTITVNAVNDIPTFNASNPPASNEDAGLQTVSSFATGFDPGPNEGGQTLASYNVSAISNSALFSVAPSVDLSGVLTYTAAANAFGSSTFQLTATDSGGATSAVNTLTITVDPVNDAPSFTASNPAPSNEDAGAQTVSSWAVFSPGPANEIGQSVFSPNGYTVNVTGTTGTLAFSSAPAVNNSGTLTYTASADTNGTATISVTVRDDAGGLDTSAAQVFTITVSAVNDAPSFVAANPPAVDEDAPGQNVAFVSTFNRGGGVDESGQAVASYNVSAVSNPGLFSAGPSVNTSGVLTYTPASDQWGSSTFAVSVTDDGTPAATSAAQTFTITVNPINDAPSFVAGANPTVAEDAGAQNLLAWASGFNAGANESSQTLAQYVVTLTSGGALLTAAPTVDTNGNLSFTPAANANGVVNFTVAVRDSGSGTLPNVNTSAASPASITITAVDDFSSFTAANPPTVNEDAGAQTVNPWVTSFTSGGGADESGQTASSYNVSAVSNPGLFSAGPSVSATGVLSYTPAGDAFGSSTFNVTVTDTGSSVSPPQTFTITVNPVNDAPTFSASNPPASAEDAGPQSILSWAGSFSAGPANESQTVVGYAVSAVSNPGLFSSGPSVDANGNLSYTAAADQSGSSTFQVTVQDSGGTANGGVDTSVAQVFTINVNAVNDAPSFTPTAGIPPVAEDSGAQTISGWAPLNIPAGFNPGGGETGQSPTAYSVVSVGNPALFSAGPSVSIANGDLTYTPAPNAFGSSTFSVTVTDDGTPAATSAPQVFSITINGVNDAPTLTTVLTIFGGLEDTVINLPFATLAAAADEQDIDSSPVSFRVNAPLAGTLSLNGTTAIPPTVTFTSGNFLEWTPPADTSGTISAFTVRAWDGALDSGTDVLVRIFIDGVNDQPSLTPSALPAIDEDSGAQTHVAWASFDPGSPNEAGQSVVSYNVTAGTPALFSVQPAIDIFGTLTYTTAPDAFGSSTIDITVRDDGGTANGGIDTSAVVQVTLNVNPINDAPSMVGSNVTVAEDAPGLLTFAGWANSFNSGAANEPDSVLGFTISNVSNPGLFNGGITVVPTAGNTGELRFTLNADVFGSSTFDVQVVDNGLPVSASSTPLTYTITVTGVNDAPSFSASNEVVNEDVGAVVLAGWAFNFNPGPNESTQSIQQYNVAVTSGGSLLSVAPAVDTSGQLTFTTAADEFGTVNFTVSVTDDGGAPGTDTSAAVPFTITINPVNDAPTFTASNPPATPEDGPPVQIVNWAPTSPPGFNVGPANEGQGFNSYTVVAGSVSNVLLFSALPTVNSSGELNYTTAPNAFGTSNFTVRGEDTGGIANGGVNFVDQMYTITVDPVNDQPDFAASNVTVLEDAGPQSITNWATFDAGQPNEVTQSVLQYNVSVLSGIGLFTTLPAVSTSGELTFETALNANTAVTSVSIQVSVQDDGGTPGVDTSANQTFSITITPVNDEPSFTVSPSNAVVYGVEDTPRSVPGWAAFNPGASNESAQTATYLISNVTNPSLFATGPTVNGATGELTFNPAPNTHGLSFFDVTVQDNGGTANGGDDTSITKNFTIIVDSVNDAPTLTTVANFTGGMEDMTFPITFAALETAANEADVDGDPLTFRIETLNSGTLTMNSNPVTPGTTVFSSGQLEWTPDLNANGLAISAFSIAAWDGLLASSPPVAVTVDVQGLNDDPVVVVNNGLTLNEGAQLDILQADLEVTDVEDAAAALTYTVDSVPVFGTLELVGPGTLIVGSTFTQADINAGSLSYDHDGTENFSDSFTFHVEDANTPTAGRLPSAGSLAFAFTVIPVNDAPTLTVVNTLTGASEDTPFGITHADLIAAADEADVDSASLSFRIEAISSGTLTKNANPVITGTTLISSGESVFWTAPLDANGLAFAAFTVVAFDGALDSGTPVQVSVDVTALNDAPSISAATVNRNEDTGANVVPGWATMNPGGGADETGQSPLVYTVVSVSNPLLFTSGAGQPAVSAATGDLTFTTAPNAFGSTTIDVTVQDDGGAPGVDTSTAQTFVINILNVNDAPTLSNVNTLFGGPEDSIIVLTFASLTAAANEADIDSFPINFRIESVLAGSLDLNSAAVVPGTSVFQNGDLLEWLPPADAFGTLNAFTVTADDGLTTSGTPIVVRVFVEGVNDRPSFIANTPPTSLEDAGSVTVNNWSSFNAGPNEQTSQAVLAYTVSNVMNTSGTLSFISGPTVDNNGNLHYQAAADTNGTATFDLIVQDTGGTTTGGLDTSDPIQTFTITVDPVNDAPSFTANNPPVILEDAGAQTGQTVATGFNTGATNEAQSVLAYLVSNVSNAGAFVGGPTVDTAGQLSYEIAANVFGTFTFDLRVQDNGGTTNGGNDTSVAQTITITVTGVNDAPSVTGGSNPTVDEDDPAQTVPGFVGINPGPNEGTQVALGYVVNVTSGAGNLSAGPSINSAGTLTFTPAADANGTVTFTVTVQDNGGTANGGVDTSLPSATFTITINAVNDAPTLTTVSLLTGATEDTAFNITYAALAAAANEADIDSTPVDFRVASIVSGTLFKAGSPPTPVIPGSTTLAATESLIWTPAADQNGILNAFSVTAWDGALASSAAITVQIDVAAVNDSPSFSVGPNITVSWDQGSQTIVGWATGISAGPADESGQALTFNVTGNTDPSLFSTQPSVSSTGTLSFIPAVNAFGTATITLTLSDNGGGTNTSAPQNFNINVTTAGEIDLQRGILTIPNGSVDNLTGGSALTPINLVYTIQNLGNGALILNGTPDLVNLSTLVNCQAWVTHPPLSNVAVSASTTFVVQIIPSSNGAFSVDFSIDSNDADEDPHTTTISGTASDAPDIDVRRAFRDTVPNNAEDRIGSYPAGTSTVFNYSIFNVGTSDLNFGATPVTISGEVNCAVLATAPAAPIAAAGNDVLALDITPSATGEFRFTVTLDTDDPDEASFVIHVIGDATSGARPELELFGRRVLSPADTEDVGLIPSGSNTTFLYEIRNVGASNLSVTTPILLTNLVNSNVIVTTTPANSVVPGDKTVMGIDVQPFAPGLFSFNFELITNDADESPMMVTVTGQSTASIAPEIAIDLDGVGIPDGGSHDLGDLAGGVFTPVAYRIRNEGTANLSVSRPALVLSEINCEVRILQHPDLSIAPQDDTLLIVGVRPLGTGPLSAMLQINNDDASEGQYLVSLTGTGPEPDLQVEFPEFIPAAPSTQVDLGSPKSGSNTTFMLTLRNVGSSSLVVTSITTGNEVNVTSSVVTSGSLGLPAGDKSDVSIQYNPTSSGAFSFSVTITSDDPDTPSYTVLFSGNARKGGGGGGKDESCSTGEGSNWYLMLFALICAIIATLRVGGRIKDQ